MMEKKILTGDSVGSLFIYDTGEISLTHTDEWQKFEETTLKLQIQQEDTTTTVVPQQ